MARRSLELFHYVMSLVCIVMVVFMVIERHWFSVPIWMFNAGMNYRIWRTYQRRRAEEVLRKLQEAAWRTRSSS